MIEWAGVRQIPGEPRRRWFSSEEFDLIVRLDDSGEFIGFELCYDKTSNEHALLWSKSQGFSHMGVDDGEQRMGSHKQTPIMVANGAFDFPHLYSAFLKECTTLPEDVAGFVLQTLEQHPEFAR